MGRAYVKKKNQTVRSSHLHDFITMTYILFSCKAHSKLRFVFSVVTVKELFPPRWSVILMCYVGTHYDVNVFECESQTGS